MNRNSTQPTSVVLAGGGTAGHTSPLIATAQELSVLDPTISLTAIGTARGLESTVVPAAGLALQLIPPVPMPRKPNLDLVQLPVRLWKSIAAAAKILQTVQADVVLGFGGYVSTPVYLAARRLKIPIVIHEQNALPGLANKLAARFTDSVFTSFPRTPLPHATCIGLPLRRSIVELDRPAQRVAARRRFGLEPELPTLLVSGGSQGAMSINNAVVGAREALIGRGIQVLHVLGPKNMAAGSVTLVDPGTGAVYQPVAFVEAMELAYAAADLMLGRCGASTVLETAAVGLPAIFVPWPHGNGEQRRNAEVVVAAGGGQLLDDAECTPAWAATRIPELMLDAERLGRMSQATSGVALSNAAVTLAQKTLEVAGR
ncbi:MAG: undecaprenyldiphospho-muramoylpentapeptide beta-N-acetylglucosaminyltransferase [Propionibacteriaceae bacterium]|nr:undecaprenyldiphospho-muramoylpentapeptide beta-N-acetylglucosaminyltransferase [Propionibacteriaceae bacterium]